MSRHLFVSLGIALVVGCGATNETPVADDDAALLACHLTRATLGPGGHVHACDPQDVKKTTICHIPPGNPANAHTICVGNAAVPAHLANHGDYVGACQTETPCPTGAGGAPGGGGVPGVDAGAAGAGGGAAGAGGSGGSIVP